MNANRQMYADLKEELLLTREQIAARVQEMGRQITEDFRGRDLTVICILKGAVVFFVDLVREIDLPMSMDFMAISSYGSATKSSGVVRILKDLDKPERRRVPLHVDYVGFTIPDEFVVGYGLDYAEKYRNLPFIGILKPDIYE